MLSDWPVITGYDSKSCFVNMQALHSSPSSTELQVKSIGVCVASTFFSVKCEMEYYVEYMESCLLKLH